MTNGSPQTPQNGGCTTRIPPQHRSHTAECSGSSSGRAQAAHGGAKTTAINPLTAFRITVRAVAEHLPGAESMEKAKENPETAGVKRDQYEISAFVRTMERSRMRCMLRGRFTRCRRIADFDPLRVTPEALDRALTAVASQGP